MNTDRAALAALYNATNGSSWQDDTNWLSNRPLGEWHGISTDADGRVTELSLGSNQLSGPIPSELGNLANLDTLVLDSNQLAFERATIPSRTGQLRQPAERAVARRPPVEIGPIPSELDNLANLDTL